MVKKFFVIFLVTLMIVTFGNYFGKVYGAGVNPIEEIEKLENSEVSESSKLFSATKTFSGTMITIFKVVGVGVAVIMLIVLAMKYMIAAPGDKADIKKHAVVYIVGAICLFGAAGILQIIQMLFSEDYSA